MKVKGVIFDLGHTLMRFRGSWEKAAELGIQEVKNFFLNHERRIPKEFFENFTLMRDKGLHKADKTNIEYLAESALQEALHRFGLNGKEKNLIQGALKAYFLPELKRWHPYPDSLQVLRKLKKNGYQVGLISNATHDPFIFDCVEQFGFQDYLNPVLTSAAFHVRKPHPEIFLHVAKSWKISPREIVMVGDQLYFDIYGAHKAEMKAVWFKQKGSKAHTYVPKKLEKDLRLRPDGIIRALSQLFLVLEKL